MQIVHLLGIRVSEIIITIGKKSGIRWRNPRIQMKSIHHSSIILTGESLLREVGLLESSAQQPLILRAENSIINTTGEVWNGSHHGDLMKDIILHLNLFAPN